MIKKSLLFLLAAIFALTSCSSESTQAKVVIATKPMTEQYILGEMLNILITTHTDLAVEKKFGIAGGTSNIQPAMVKGDIDMYPEYTGTGWSIVLKETKQLPANELYDAVKDKYERQFNIIWKEKYGFDDTFGLAVRKETAEKYNVKTFSDLAKVSKELSLGAEYDFFEREDGYPGISKAYGFDFGKKSDMDIGLKYEAIKSKEVDVITIFTTDAKLEEYGLVSLEDDKHFFPSYDAATLVRRETLTDHPELEKVTAMLENKISNETMTKLNYQVEVEHKEAHEVAKTFLEENGLLKK